jgi:hypothetical protein
VNARGLVNRLILGPIIGHTDHESTRIWIQVRDHPSFYKLRVYGVGLFDFVSTETGPVEFGTAIATVAGLRPDRIHRYQVFRNGRFVPQTRGQFRTMPDPTSMTDIQFVAISCSSGDKDGIWPQFEDFVREAKPHFLLMMGDQVYIDEDQPDVFETHFESRSPVRRRALADKYRLNWSREPVRRVLANVPTYMIWDDHDIVDGWGSSAQCSPTLAEKHPRARPIFEKFNAYFEDCRDVYWHFQGCRNPLPQETINVGLPNYFAGPPVHGIRRAMPYAFRWGRIVVLVLDSRGQRDVFREEYPVLGGEQWQFIDAVLDNLSADIEALVVVTPTPVASMDPEGQTQKLLGRRTDDVELFKAGDLDGLLNLRGSKGLQKVVDLGKAIAGTRLSRITGHQFNFGAFQLNSIDEARDQWSNYLSRSEQIELIRKAGKARLSNRAPGNPRSLLFLAGDIHVGGIFDISCSSPDFKAPLVISSGISQNAGGAKDPLLGVFLDEDFEVAPGIRSTMRDFVNDFNFGVINIIPTGAGARIEGAVAHEGTSFGYGVDIRDLTGL